ncbi:MAG: tetraacyldisaccharide 4'-kinase, partial [Pseudomonadota bacterium]|nr:tetraacyldisaccharide 4'-kinase [Pseudomonadota bacterium]
MSLWLERLWYDKHPLYWLLIPFSLLYQLLMFLRRKLYQLGLLQVVKLPVPVIVVGNLTVGGTGKTPCVLAITEWLRQQGEFPGIVSRGYKATTRHFPANVTTNSSAVEMGDEPVLLAQRSGCPVVIDPDRVRGAKFLLTEHHCTIIVADDGLQHYRLARDVEILVIDGRRR